MKATAIGHIIKPEDGGIHIQMNPTYWPGTLELDKFSHIIVLWWITGMDNDEARMHLQNYPPIEGAPLSGVFASRSPGRPTPIGMTTVKIVSIDSELHRIFIDQIDAIDGTPVVDIKPYIPFSDKVDRAKVPDWLKNNVPRYTDHPLD